MTKLLPGATIDWGDPITRGLRNCYLMNEGAGSLVNNIVDFKANGRMTNMVQGTTSGWAGSDFGGGIKYDGVNDYIDIVNDTELDWIKSSSFAISVWAKPYSGSPNFLAFFDRGYVSLGASSYGLTFYHDIGTSTIWMIRNTGTSSGSLSRYATLVLAPSFNKFDHYLWSYNKENATFQLWVNGIKRNITYGGNAINSLDVSFHATWDAGYNIGALRRNVSDIYGYGTIDSVRIWNRPLSSAEACRVYNEYDSGIFVPQIYAFPIYGLGAWKGKLATAGNTGTLTANTSDSNSEAYMVMSFRGLQASVTVPPSITPTKSISPSISVSITVSVSRT